MRIASLVPSATEALFALGLGDSVVAVTHECDWPEAARALPKLTSSVIPEGLAPGEIDARVREVTGRGEALYRLDEDTLAELEPDLIVTQALCAVCAVSYDDVRAVAGRLPSRPRVISLDPENLEDVLGDLIRLAWATGNPRLGERLLKGLRLRLANVASAVGEGERPRVAALEWLDPVYLGGHWVPEMIAAAGGEDVLGRAGEKSRVAEWDEVAAQAREHAERLHALGAGRIVAVDAASSFSRPGPRLVDGVELLAHLFHPGRVEAPAEIAFETVWDSTAPSTPSR